MAHRVGDKMGQVPELLPCTKPWGTAQLRGAEGKGLLCRALAAGGHSQEGPVRA